MAKLIDGEREELLRFAGSAALRDDMRTVAAQRHNPVMVDGVVDADRLITFLTEYNAFLNHKPKPFRKMIDREMLL